MVAILGLPDGALGVAWPSMRHTLHRPIGDLGILALAGILPYLLASTGVVRVVRRTGFGTMAAAVAAFATAGMAVWAAAPVWVVALGANAAFGVSRGAVDSAFNAYISEHEGVRRLGLLHAGYGVGATLGPLLVAAVLSLGAGWRVALAVLAGINLAMAVATFRARRVWKPLAAADGEAVPGPDGHQAVVAVLLLTFAVYVAAEAGVGQWAFSIGFDGRHLDRGVCAAAVASYWAALTGGRLLLAAIGGRVSREAILIVGTLLAVTGIAIFWLDRSATGLLGLAPAGFGFSATFPVAISLVPDYVGERRSAHIIGWCVAAAAVGAPAGAFIGGQVANRAGLAAVPPVFLGLALGLLGCLVALTRTAPAAVATD